MKAAFVVTLDLPTVDQMTLESTAAQIADELADTGLMVLQVNPWNRPSNAVGLMQDIKSIQGESIIRGGSSPSPLTPPSGGPVNQTIVEPE